MRLESLIQTLLLTPIASVPGCYWGCGKLDPVDEIFSDTWELNNWDIERLTADETVVITTCEELCREYYTLYRSDLVVDSFVVTECSTDLALPLSYDPDAARPDTSDTYAGNDVQGTLTCTGRLIGEEPRMCEGRRPLGHREQLIQGPSLLARRLASMAHLEAAAILAFDELAEWLSARRAPTELIQRCREAAEDERRHARVIGALARRHGAEPPTPIRDPIDPCLFTVALHNAVEGCVHESWAALEAHWQAQHIAPELRSVFAAIADDETRHGQLAWDLHDWLLPQLSAADRARVLSAQSTALRALPRAVSTQPDALGQPSGATGRRLARRFARQVAANAYGRTPSHIRYTTPPDPPIHAASI